jgi:hypothetical protein
VLSRSCARMLPCIFSRAGRYTAWRLLSALLSAVPSAVARLLHLIWGRVCNTSLIASLCLQDIALSGLLLSLHACVTGNAPQEYRAVVFESVRQTAADSRWRSKLVRALCDLHSVADGASFLTQAAVRSIPETGILLMLRTAPVRTLKCWGRLHLVVEPKGPSKDPTGHGSGKHAPQMRTAYFLACLMRVAPESILSACEGPAIEFDRLSPEKQALEPSMEYTIIEICHAALVSGAAFLHSAGSATSAWQVWLGAVLQGRYESATLDKSGVLTLAIANALRMIANEATGTQKLAPEARVEDGGQLLSTVQHAIGELLDKWSGASASDCKHAMLLAYSLDLMVQVRWQQLPATHLAYMHHSDCWAASTAEPLTLAVPVLISKSRHNHLPVKCV